MDILQIKEQLGIPSLQLHTAKDLEGNNTEWMRHWQNDTRVAVSFHKDLVAKIKEDPKGVNSLDIQTETREGEQGEYTAHRVVQYTPAEVVL